MLKPKNIYDWPILNNLATFLKNKWYTKWNRFYITYGCTTENLLSEFFENYFVIWWQLSRNNQHSPLSIWQSQNLFTLFLEKHFMTLNYKLCEQTVNTLTKATMSCGLIQVLLYDRVPPPYTPLWQIYKIFTEERF